MAQFVFKFYICGGNPQHRDAAAALQGLCEAETLHEYLLDVIDVAERPAEAAADRILATPALVRINPAPMRRLVGDCSSPRRLLAEFGAERMAD
jgi:circadian clock protein KaiB